MAGFAPKKYSAHYEKEKLSHSPLDSLAIISFVFDGLQGDDA